MAADPCPVMRIRARSRAVTGRSIIDRGRRRSIIRSASGTKRGGRNGCRGSHNGAGNREWKQKRVTVKAFLGARSCDRNSDEKSESYACSNYQLSCTHFCLPTFMVNAAFQFDISLTYRHSKLSTLEREKQLTLKFSHANGTRCHPRCCRGCVLPSLLRFAPGLQESGLLPKTCVSKNIRIQPPAQKRCRGDGYGNLSAVQELSRMALNTKLHPKR